MQQILKKVILKYFLFRNANHLRYGIETRLYFLWPLASIWLLAYFVNVFRDKSAQDKMASEETKPLTNGIDDGQSAARTSQSQGVAAEIARPNNFQKIAQKKMMVKSFPRQKKLEKLAVYNSCKVWFINNIIASSLQRAPSLRRTELTELSAVG